MKRIRTALCMLLWIALTCTLALGLAPLQDAPTVFVHADEPAAARTTAPRGPSNPANKGLAEVLKTKNTYDVERSKGSNAMPPIFPFNGRENRLRVTRGEGNGARNYTVIGPKKTDASTGKPVSKILYAATLHNAIKHAEKLSAGGDVTIEMSIDKEGLTTQIPINLANNSTLTLRGTIFFPDKIADSFKVENDTRSLIYDNDTEDRSMFLLNSGTLVLQNMHIGGNQYSESPHIRFHVAQKEFTGGFFQVSPGAKLIASENTLLKMKIDTLEVSPDTHRPKEHDKYFKDNPDSKEHYDSCGLLDGGAVHLKSNESDPSKHAEFYMGSNSIGAFCSGNYGGFALLENGARMILTDNSVIMNCYSNKDGGAIALQNSHSTSTMGNDSRAELKLLNNSMMSHCTSYGNGGAVSVSNDSIVELDGSHGSVRIEECSATKSGGAIFLQNRLDDWTKQATLLK